MCVCAGMHLLFASCFTDMWGWLSLEKSNAKSVNSLMAKQSVQERMQAEQRQRDLEEAALYKEWLIHHAPMRQKQNTTAFCKLLSNALVDGAVNIAEMKRTNGLASVDPLPSAASAQVVDLVGLDNVDAVAVDDIISPTADLFDATSDLVSVVARLVAPDGDLLVPATDANPVSPAPAPAPVDDAAPLVNPVPAGPAPVDVTSADVDPFIVRHFQASYSLRPVLKTKQSSDLTWLERSALIWLYLCPEAFSHLSGAERLKRVATSGGVSWETLKKWVNLSPKKATVFTPKWYNIVKSMKWVDVKKFFPKRWASKLGHLKLNLTVKAHLSPWLPFTKEAPVTLSKYADIAPAKRAGLAKKRPSMFLNVTAQTKRVKRSDAGRARKYCDIVDGTEKYILERWNTGDPTTRRQVSVVCVFSICVLIIILLFIIFIYSSLLLLIYFIFMHS